jgi:tetratricopeptide (TPR) repeat protein
MTGIERNTPCPCGSGRKYKKCCMEKHETAIRNPDRSPDDLDDLSNRANDLIREGRWDEAETVCQQLEERYPEQIDAVDRRGQLYEAKGAFPEALHWARLALARSKADPTGFDQEGILDYEEWVDDLTKRATP